MAPFTCRPPATLTTPAALTVPEWHLLHVVGAEALWWLAVPGGDLWQLPQSAAAPSQVQVRVVFCVVVGLSDAPWQYVVHVVCVVVPLPCTKVGVNPARFAPVAVANVTFTTLLEWLMFPALFGWHSMQATGLYTAPAAAGFTCERCVPTRTPVVAPAVSTGGAAAWFRSAPATLARAAEPWHDVQVRPTTSIEPFRCVVRLTDVAV